MTIKVKLYGNLRRHSPAGHEANSVIVAPGATVKSVLSALGVPDSDWWMVAVNDQVVSAETLVHDDDEVEVFEPVGGG